MMSIMKKVEFSPICHNCLQKAGMYGMS
uniref:Uncharacterized protein n=1 Tax=Rhizophora mucronata TaxID=61149 RepID=A0A2P2NC78_RHIMU